MAKKIDRRKIVINAGSVLLASAVGTGISISLYHNGIDHLNEYCSFNVINPHHQVDYINSHYGDAGITAYYAENGVTTIYSELARVEIDGQECLVAPPGFDIMDNGKGVKAFFSDSSSDAIVITQGTPVYSRVTKSEEFINKSVVGVYDPQVINVIEIPDKSR